jgi:hypothetical protein
MFENFYNYLKYSGLTVTINFNPFHWNFVPRYHRNTEWGSDNEHGISFLFLSVRLWIDDGSW